MPFSCLLVAASFALAAACACPRPAPHAAREPARALQVKAAQPQVAPPAPSRPSLLPVAELAALDLEPRIGPYLSRDAAWGPGQPVVVSRDFDFAIAMTMEDIGPGIAAKKRRDGNLALAEQLAQLPPIDSNAVLAALCGAAPPDFCPSRAGERFAIYGLLYGDREPRLLVIVEAATGAEPALQAVLANGSATAAWLEPGTLQRAFEDGAKQLAADLFPRPEIVPETAACALTPATKLSGRVLRTHDDRILLLTSRPTLRLSCPRAAVGPAAPPSQPPP